MLATSSRPVRLHALDVAGIVETDVQHGLLGRARHVEGELAGVARDIIPVVLIELADEARPAERPDHRIAGIDAGLDRGDQLVVENGALMVDDARAAGVSAIAPRATPSRARDP